MLKNIGNNILPEKRWMNGSISSSKAFLNTNNRKGN
jgi:hypothetical protein